MKRNCEYEVFLGGNTLGYTFIGKEDGKSYLQKFYSDDYLKKIYSGEEKGSLSVQIERKDNYVYYSLVVYGIANIEGRKGEGEHFNLTLRLSNYYFTDICLLYNTMVNIYNTQILNHIIKNSKYVIDNFVTQTTLHKQVQSNFANILYENLLSPLEKLASAKNNSIYRRNPKDISRDLIKDLLQTYTTIIINSDYSTKDKTITSLNKQIEQLKKDILQKETLIRDEKNKEILDKDNQLQQCKEEYDKLKTQIREQINKETSDINKQLQHYRGECSKLKSHNTDLQEQLQKANGDLKKYELHGNISNLLLQLREPVLTLSKYFSPHESEPKPNPPKPPQQPISKRLVLLIICIVLLVVVLFQVCNLNSDVKSLDSKIDNIEKIQTEQQSNKESNSTADTIANKNKGDTLQQNREQTSTETGTETRIENQNNNSEQPLFKRHPLLKTIRIYLVVSVVLLIFVCPMVYYLMQRKTDNKTGDNTDNKPNNKAKQNPKHK